MKTQNCALKTPFQKLFVLKIFLRQLICLSLPLTGLADQSGSSEILTSARPVPWTGFHWKFQKMDSFLDAFIIAVDYTEKLENKEANRIIEMESVKSENEEIINKLQKKMQQFEGRFFETILQIPDDIFVPMILSINEMLFLLG